MICPPHGPAPVVEDWLARHRHPASFLLHMVGIPMSLAGFLLVPFCLGSLSPAVLLFSAGLFVGGYLLQFLGHFCEGSEPGEITKFREWWHRRSQRRTAALEPGSRTAGTVG